MPRREAAFGKERGALIDTGNGVGDLRGYVEELLKGKPYDVIVTHGHVDHASGADQFDRVFIAFFGDACGVEVLLLTQEATSIEEYRESLKRLRNFAGRYDRVLRNHGACESPCSVLDDNIEVCEKILAGTDDAVPAAFQNLPCIRAMKVDPESRKRLDGKEGNILYLPEKIRQQHMDEVNI